MTSKFAAMALEVEKPGRMLIKHPSTREILKDESGASAYVDVYSSDSDVANRHRRAVQSRRIEDIRARRGAEQPTVAALEAAEADGIDLLVTLTAGWYLVGLDGVPIELTFTKEEARELYAEPGMRWLRDQVDAYADDRANFVKASLRN